MTFHRNDSMNVSHRWTVNIMQAGPGVLNLLVLPDLVRETCEASINSCCVKKKNSAHLHCRENESEFII